MSHNEQNFATRIRELGYRMTPQRQTVLDALCALGGHAPIAQIVSEAQTLSPSIDRATVYRTIKMLHDNQLVLSAEIDGMTLYEISEPTPHHHLVCRNCGTVQACDNQHFNSLVRRIRKEFGFSAELNHLTLAGLCANCL